MYFNINNEYIIITTKLKYIKILYNFILANKNNIIILWKI